MCTTSPTRTGRDIQSEPARSSSEPPRIGIVFALGVEAGGLVDRMDAVVTTRGAGFVAYEARIANRAVVVTVTDEVGREAARRATDALVRGHRAAPVVSAGFSGGLDPRLARGDLVLADEVVDVRGNGFPVDPPAVPSGVAWHVGRLLTIDRIVRLPEDKLALGQRHAAVAVDMESHAVAERCRESGVRFLALRVVSDTVDECLPKEIEQLSAQRTPAARAGAAVAALWRRPAVVRDLWRMKEASIEASDRLAGALESVIGSGL